MIHGIWFGDLDPADNPVILACSETWPIQQVHMWRDVYDLARVCPTVGNSHYFLDALEAGNYAAMSDYARLALLWQFGGVYLDMDMEIIDLAALRQLEQRACASGKFFAGWEDEKGLCGAVMIAGAEHPFVGAMLDRYKTLKFSDTFNGVDNGTTLLAKEASKWGQSNRTVFVEPEVFYPWHWKEKDLPEAARRAKITEATICAHHWLGSWL